MLLGLGRLSAWLAMALAFGWTLSFFYALVGQTSSLSPAWVPIALIHTLFALCLITVVQPVAWKSWLQEGRWKSVWAWGPGLGLIAVTATSSVITGHFLPAATPLPLLASTPGNSFWLWVGSCIWVPLIEELIFRRGVGRLLKQRAGFWLGIYLASLIFALAHTGFPSGGSWTEMSAPPLGPFLLSLACELLYWRSQSLLGPLLLHAACNATPLIFLLLDPRWLDWLQVLYMRA